jgi:MOSC domain-containing protein YiiM
MERAGTLLGIATKEKTRAPMLEHVALAVGPRGLAGERPHAAVRAITLLAREAWQEVCRQLGTPLPWTLRRANLLVDGVELAACVGRRLRVGAALLEVSEENPPCRVMDVLHPGLRAALAPDGRGGVACRVIEPGSIHTGAAVRLEA